MPDIWARASSLGACQSVGMAGILAREGLFVRGVSNPRVLYLLLKEH